MAGQQINETTNSSVHLNPDTILSVLIVHGHGVVTLDRKRAKAFIGNKLSHARKPSAYKGKNNYHSKTRGTSSGKTKVVSAQDTLKKRNLNGLKQTTDHEEEGPSNKKAALEIETCQVENNEQHDGQSDYFERREQRIKENKLEMWKIGLLTKSEATIVALFFLGIPKLQDVQMKVLKQACLNNNVPFTKLSKKNHLCELLGEFLYEEEIRRRKNDDEGFTYIYNLKSMITDI